jgi:hypothetical protein
MSLKIPGWGLCRIIEKRVRDGVEKAFITCPTHEAPFWVGLTEIARHQARIIYSDNPKQNENSDETN